MEAFAFGDAQFRGSMADGALAYPVSGIARSAGDDSYWPTVGGGVFSFGSARLFGPHGGQGRRGPRAVGVTPDGRTRSAGQVRAERASAAALEASPTAVGAVGWAGGEFGPCRSARHSAQTLFLPDD